MSPTPTSAPPTAGSDSADDPVPLCAALADETRWAILRRLGSDERSASELAQELPVTRQAIARHLGVLEAVGLVESSRQGRQLRYRAIGAPLSRLATQLDTIGRGWDARLDRLRTLAEGQASS